jgi:hypothetical protein
MTGSPSQGDDGLAIDGLEARDVDEGLEDAARLAARLHAAVELGDAVVASAHEGQQLSGTRPDCDETSLEGALRLLGQKLRVALLDARDAFPQCDRREALQAPVQRGVDAQALFSQHLGGVDVRELSLEKVQEVARVSGFRRHGREPQWLVQRGLVGRLVEAPLSDHQLEHQVAPLHGSLGLAVRRDPVGALDDGGQQPRLRNAEILCPLPEEVARRFADAVDRRRTALPEVDLVEVRLEDGVLVVSGLHDERHQRFLDLAAQRPLRCEEEVLDELLSEGASPLADRARAQVRDHRSDDAARIDAVVGVEALVLYGQHRVDHVVRQILEVDELALLPGRAVVRAELLRLEQHGTELLPAGHRADLADARAGKAQHDVAGRLGTTGMRERAQVHADPVAPPDELSSRQRAARGRLAIAEAQERAAQVHLLPVESGVEDRGCGVDAGRHAEAHALEAPAHRPVELHHAHGEGEARRERRDQGAERDAPRPARHAAAEPGSTGPRPAAPAAGLSAARPPSRHSLLAPIRPDLAR